MLNTQMKNEVINLMERLSENEFLTAKRFIEFLIAQRGEFFREPLKSERKAIAKKLYGICAHLPGGREEFIKEKYEDIEREEQKFKERCH